MRKKSHISLARYLVLRSGNQEFRKHRLAFYLGSILPDCKPSFLYRRHEMNATFEDVAETIIRLSKEQEAKKNRRVYYRNLGQITHYVADYFTFPHNSIYPGTLSEHCSYEERLKKELKKYLWDGGADRYQYQVRAFGDAQEIIAYIRREHENYLQKKLDVTVDIQEIVRVNYQTLFGIMNLVPYVA